ncbi:hypothetical protein CAPTEDRAFT_206360 [Capitella teleta]|uniref:Methyltransferase domain-containing protein n=1 Tax=Capitella teleta TaxID=283909 RepID=R7UC40_CAPTE|nr:hypothetical protein CAPTEDRAFT_206360 [Capitella teleta]|eukprot:ELU03686.1 hypothetical protein CAPTEDRAFT_206360 [Capitella teleta]
MYRHSRKVSILKDVFIIFGISCIIALQILRMPDNESEKGAGFVTHRISRDEHVHREEAQTGRSDEVVMREDLLMNEITLTASEPVAIEKPKGVIKTSKVQYDIDDTAEKLLLYPRTKVVLSANSSLEKQQKGFYSYIEAPDAHCRNVSRMGNLADGGWNICQVAPYNLKKDNCLVYSFGINNEWSFDDAVADTYGCEVKSFDPSMDVGDHKRGSLISFYAVGLSGRNHVDHRKWRMRTLGSILSDIGDEGKVIDYLKMDIEYSEWTAMEAMFDEGVMDNIKQIAFELHIPVDSQRASHYEKWALLERLASLGFKKWDVEHNTYSVTGEYKIFCCTNIYYINTRFLAQRNQDKITSVDDPNKAVLSGDKFAEMNIKNGADMKTAENIYFQALTNIQATCPLSVLRNHWDLNEWDLCEAGKFYTNGTLNPCLVYLFETAEPSIFLGTVQRALMCEYKKLVYSERVVTSDTMHAPYHHYSHGYQKQSEKPYPGKYPFVLSEFMRFNSHLEREIDIIHIDVDTLGWELVDALLKDGHFLKVKQIIMRVYNKEEDKQADMTEYLRILKALYRAGFLKWKTHSCKFTEYKSRSSGEWRSRCYEMMYINKMYMSASYSA